MWSLLSGFCADLAGLGHLGVQDIIERGLLELCPAVIAFKYFLPCGKIKRYLAHRIIVLGSWYRALSYP